MAAVRFREDPKIVNHLSNTPGRVTANRIIANGIIDPHVWEWVGEMRMDYTREGLRLKVNKSGLSLIYLYRDYATNNDEYSGFFLSF